MSDDELFGDQWLTKHLARVRDEIMSRDPIDRPRLTGERADLVDWCNPKDAPDVTV